MEKEIKKFVQLSSIIAVILLTVILISSLGLISIYLAVYRRIIVYVIVAASAIFLLLWLVSAELVKANRSGSARGLGIYALRLGMRLVLPAFMYFAGLFKGDKDWLGRIYININNLVVKYGLKKKPTAKMLVLLPHCMQSKDCSCRITEDIANCRRCGCCRIGEAAAIMGQYGIKAVVAKGGTAARNTVKEFRPDFILAIACERELVSGIGDVGSVPVIGIINQRPDGYCSNTTVDMVQLKKTLNELIGKETGLQDAAIGRMYRLRKHT
ncbi:MAG: hypothetical protein APF77_00325 [Clostridia bacterium BRH_c25]|nr:MAG: hypothetical protein APF77_00325 [Clostridia bacterium BRH_c25]